MTTLVRALQTGVTGPPAIPHRGAVPVDSLVRRIAEALTGDPPDPRREAPTEPIPEGLGGDLARLAGVLASVDAPDDVADGRVEALAAVDAGDPRWAADLMTAADRVRAWHEAVLPDRGVVADVLRLPPDASPELVAAVTRRAQALLDIGDAGRTFVSRLRQLSGRLVPVLLVAAADDAVARAIHGVRALALHGRAPGAVVVTRVVPEPPRTSSAWHRSRARRDAGAVWDVRTVMARACPDVPVVLVPEIPADVSVTYAASVAPAVDRLRALRITSEPWPQVMTVDGDPRAFDVVWPLPTVERRDVAVATTDEHLHVTVDGLTRVWPLPPVLLRCRAITSRFDDGVLTVRHVADADRWPREAAATTEGVVVGLAPRVPRRGGSVRRSAGGGRT